MSEGLVSIVIPSYNYASYLDKRINSILAQTYQNIELIIIDDCSIDNSGEVLKKYTGHPKIQVVLKKRNEGWISTNNQGIALARGNYVLFAQCDDICEKSMVEKLVDSLEKYPSAGIAFCRSVLVDENARPFGEDYSGREKNFQRRCQNDTLLSKNEAAKFLLHSCVIPNLSAVLIRKQVFTVAGIFPADYPACSDWAWFLNITEYFDIAYVASPLNHFMQHGKTIRHLTKDKVLYEEYFRLLILNRKKFNLSFFDRCRARFRVVSLWSNLLIAPSASGIINFPYHFLQLLRLDPIALLLLPAAVIVRSIVLFRKVARV